MGSISYENIEGILNGDRDYPLQIETEKQCLSIMDDILFVYKKYLLWTIDEFESAIEYVETLYEDRQIYLNTTHKGIYERMKCHSSIRGMSFGEKLVYGVLTDKKYDFKQECYIGHSDADAQSIKLDFVVFYNNVLYVVEYNGEQHYKPIEKFGGEEQFKIQQANDKKKKIFCETYNIPFLEIPYTVRTKEEVSKIIDNFIK